MLPSHSSMNKPPASNDFTDIDMPRWPNSGKQLRHEREIASLTMIPTGIARQASRDREESSTMTSIGTADSYGSEARATRSRKRAAFTEPRSLST
jgi:hypothetical protein